MEQKLVCFVVFLINYEVQFNTKYKVNQYESHDVSIGITR